MYLFGGLLGAQRFILDGGLGADLLGITFHRPGDGLNLILRPSGTVENNFGGVFHSFERIAVQGWQAQDDVFGGGALDDVFYGDRGSDTVTYRYATAGVTIQLADDAVDTIGAGVDEFRGIDNLIGTRFADVLTGDAVGGANALSGAAGDDVLTGLGGKDVLDGGAGADVLDGGDAADVLIGGGGHDVLSGGYARDVLVGGAGADRMAGDEGADTFRFDLLTDLNPGQGLDRILDFSTADGDRIDLSALDADPVTDGDQAFAFLGTAAFTGAASTAGEVRYEVGASGFLLVQGDLDHDGVADFSLLVRAPALAATDFAL